MRPERIEVDGQYGSFIVDKEEWNKFPRNYTAIYERLMEELKDDERVGKIMLCYDEQAEGVTIQIFTDRCTLFRLNEAFLPDHSNDKALTEKFIDEWLKLPAVESDKEQYEGIWKRTGKKIKFNREWNNYRFSDEQCEALLDEQRIEFITEAKDGTEKAYCGILDEQEYKGFKFFGFKLDGWAVPLFWGNRKLTEQERASLRSGKVTPLKGLINKQGKRYAAKYKYDPQNGMQFDSFFSETSREEELDALGSYESR